MGQLVNDAGVTVFEGEIIGAGIAPVQGVYSGAAVTINNGSAGLLSFDSLDSGSALLDLSTPDSPPVLAAGTYTVTASGTCNTALTAGGFVSVLIGLGSLAASSEIAHPEYGFSVVLTADLLAGDQITVGVLNLDGVSAHDFALSSGVIVRLA